MRTLVLFINGIHADPGDADGWTDRAVTWTHTRTPDGVYGEKFEYHTNFATRFIRQRARIAACANMIGFYRRAGFTRIIGVGHSNGCAILAGLLTRLNVPLESVHLFAPAAEPADFATALRQGSVGRIYLYGSTKDAPLRLLAPVSKLLFGWAGLGYGNLGAKADQFTAAHPGDVVNVSNNTYGHSDWFARGDQFEDTMRQIFEHEQIPVFTPRIQAPTA